MTFEIWILYVGTVLLYMSTPGPSHLLMLSVSISNGFRKSLATAAGDLSANAIQIIMAGLGLAAVLTASRYGFTLVKWAGVGYLVWLGLRQIIASFKHRDQTTGTSLTSLKKLWLRGFMTSAANPKAVVFFAALFPQFINQKLEIVSQIAILGLTYIVIDGLFLCAYGKGASWIAQKVSHQYSAWIDRVGGAGLIAAALLLGLKSSQNN